MTVESLVARGWQEHLHPRDWRGWFITKGARVEIGGGLTGVVQEVNVGRAGDPASVRVKVRADNGRTGWVPTDRITVAQPPRGSVYLGDGSVARVGSPVMHTDEPGVDYVKKIAPDGGPVTVGKQGDDTSDREVDPTSLHGGSAPPPVRTPGAGPTARVAPAVRIKNALPHTRVNLDGIDPAFQNEIADAIIEVTNAFPLLKERGMLPSVQARRLTGRESTTRAFVNMTNGDMVFNLQHFKDTIGLGNPRSEEASGFTSARGISRARATTIHELGHSLHRAIEFKKGVRFVTAEQMNRETKRLVDDAAASSGVPSWSRLEIKDGLSTYGSTLPVETVAESFLEAFTEGPNTRPIARSVTDQLLARGGLDKTPLNVNRGGQRASSPTPAPRQRFVAPRPVAPTPGRGTRGTPGQQKDTYERGDIVKIGDGYQEWTVYRQHDDGMLFLVSNPSRGSQAGTPSRTRMVPKDQVRLMTDTRDNPNSMRYERPTPPPTPAPAPPPPTALPPAPTPTPDVPTPPTADTPIAPGDRVTNTGNGITGTVRTVRPSGIVMYEDDNGRLRSGRIERFQRADAPGDAPTPAPTPDPTPAPPEAPTPPPAPEPDVPTPAPPAPTGDAPIGPGDRITVNGRTGTVRTVRPSGIVMYNDDEGRLRSAQLSRVQRVDQPNAPEPSPEPSPSPTGYTPTGDMSNVEALTDEQLQAELDAAIAERRAVIEGGAPRTSIAYTDAHLKVNVFSVEQRRRNGATPPPAAEPTPAPPAATPTMDDFLNMTRNEPRDAALRAMTTEQLTELRRETWAEVSRMNRQQRFGDRGRLTRANRLISAIQNETRGRREADTPPTDRPEFTPRNVLEHLGNENFGTDELARAFGVPQGQMLQMLRQLERGEYVARNNGNDGGDSVSGGRRTISTLGWEIATGRDGDHAEIMRRFDEANGDGETPSPVGTTPDLAAERRALNDAIAENTSMDDDLRTIEQIESERPSIVLQDLRDQMRQRPNDPSYTIEIDGKVYDISRALANDLTGTRTTQPTPTPPPVPAPPTDTPAPPPSAPGGAPAVGERINAPGGRSGVVTSVRTGTGVIMYRDDEGRLRSVRIDRAQRADSPAAPAAPTPAPAPAPSPTGARRSGVDTSLPRPTAADMQRAADGTVTDARTGDVVGRVARDGMMTSFDRAGRRTRSRQVPAYRAFDHEGNPAGGRSETADGAAGSLARYLGNLEERKRQDAEILKNAPSGDLNAPVGGGPNIAALPSLNVQARTTRTEVEFQKRIAQQLEEMYNGGPDGPGLGRDGVRMSVRSFEPSGPNSFELHGSLVNKDGDRIGRVSRTINFVNGRPNEIHNDLMVVDPAMQGQGIANDLYRRQEEWARANGVEKITIEANIDVGGYAWARKGYDYSSPLVAQNHLRKLLDRASSNQFAKSSTTETRTALENAYNAANAAANRPGNSMDGIPTPYEISTIGYTPGAQTWPGKELMLGTHWDAVKYLQRPDRAQVNPNVTDGISAPGTDAWKPVMSREEADRWSANSAVPTDLFHATRHPRELRAGGFDLDKATGQGAVYTTGVYLGMNEPTAALYERDGTETLTMRANVTKPLTVSPSAINPGYTFRKEVLEEKLGERGREAFRQALIGAGFDPKSKTLPEFDNPPALAAAIQAEGYDSIIIQDAPGPNGKPDQDIGGQQLIVFDPKKIAIVE